MSPSWITALLWQRGMCNSMKLWVISCKPTQDRCITVKISDKMWSTGEGNGNPLQYYCLKTPMNSMKRQKDMMPEDEPPAPPGQKVFNMLLGKSGGQLLIAPIRMKQLGQSRNATQPWMCLGWGVEWKQSPMLQRTILHNLECWVHESR